MPPPDVAERKSDHWGCEGVQNRLRHASLYHLKQLFRSQHGATGGGLDYICMDKIYIQDARNHVLSFDLKEVLAAIGQPALEAYWTVGPVERNGEPFEVIGKDIRLVEALAASGERVSGYRLQELAADIRQTIWGEFKGYNTCTAAIPWVIIIAFDSTWFEVHSSDAAILDQLKEQFKNITPPTWSVSWTP